MPAANAAARVRAVSALETCAHTRARASPRECVDPRARNASEPMQNDASHPHAATPIPSCTIPRHRPDSHRRDQRAANWPNPGQRFRKYRLHTFPVLYSTSSSTLRSDFRTRGVVPRDSSMTLPPGGPAVEVANFMRFFAHSQKPWSQVLTLTANGDI